MDIMTPGDVQMPGGDAFREITTMFEEAAADMEPGSFLFMDGFTLQDAMSAFEIGEPRLDSGMFLEEDLSPPFDPLVPLLPQELCWILDRSFACEMEWHAGNTLSQTVFTLQYMHHLPDLNPDMIIRGPIPGEDDNRSVELLSVILRSFIFGMLKCCDLSWREMSKSKLHDGEDWQGEKCEVSLLEGYPVKYVLQKLDDAIFWLENTSQVDAFWKTALLPRILLRKTILSLMELRMYKDAQGFQTLIAMARECLQSIRSCLPPMPEPGSPALLAFDPYIARRLHSFLPLRVYELPPPDKVWKAIEVFLKEWESICLLSTVANVSTWDIAGCLRVWLPKPHQGIPYLRSCAQSAFFDGVLVLNKFTPDWIVDRFFVETLGISRERFTREVKERWLGAGTPPIADVERVIVMIFTEHIKAHWFNTPRRRRHFMRSLLDWHALYDSFLNLVTNLAPIPCPDIISQAPNAVLLWRLSVLREVVLSGFQLELYSSGEQAFAYWYTTQIIEAHLHRIDDVIEAMPHDTLAHSELTFQLGFLTALQCMSTAMLSLSITTTLSQERIKLNFLKRYKWVFRPEYEELDSPVVALPEFVKFAPAWAAFVKDECYSPSNAFNLAKHILLHLTDSSVGWAGQWANGRKELIKSLVDVCENLESGAPYHIKDISDLNILKWDPQRNPWFPTFG